MKVKNKRNFYQKQKRAMMATRIGFLTFFKLGWSNKVDSTPWRKRVDIRRMIIDICYSTSMIPIWEPRPRERSMQKNRQDQMGAPGIFNVNLD